VPLLHRERAIGLLALSSTTPGAYTSHHGDLVLAVASQAAVAIENARLYAQAQESARKTAALARVASRVVLGGPLESALDEVARAVAEASGAVACGLLIGGDDPTRSLIAGAHGLPDGYTAALEAIWRSGVRFLTATARYFEPGPVVVRDIWRTVLAGEEWAPLHRFRDVVAWDTMVSLPLAYGERRQGRLNLYYAAGREPDEAEMAFLAAVANQAAIAVENARLYAEAEGKAALEERQRLARELHDSVSQALYGIALGAATARTLLDRDPPGAAGPLDYVRGLAEAGLAEMRALIFELRPESLEVEGLVAALAKQAAAARARHELQVEADLGDEPALPPAAKEALYRIAQEALHNVVKHAGARRVTLRLASEGDDVVLEVGDDGVGFAADGAFPGHLGLRSMRERAERVGGTLGIESAPGRGTTVRARVPRPVA
jgi:signal transduction histidine kinase